jgi:hypothetical protein
MVPAFVFHSVIVATPVPPQARHPGVIPGLVLQRLSDWCSPGGRYSAWRPACTCRRAAFLSSANLSLAFCAFHSINILVRFWLINKPYQRNAADVSLFLFDD